MEEDDCILISDDEDVQLIKHVVNLEPVIIDLTIQQQPPSPPPQSQTPPQPPPPPPPPPAQTLTPSPPPPSPPQTPPPPETETRTPTPPPPPAPPTQPPISSSPPPPPQSPPSQPQQPQSQPQHPSPPSPPQPRPQTTPSPPPPPPPPHQHSTPFSSHQEINQKRQIPHKLPNPAPKKPPPSDREVMIAMKNLGNEKYKHNLFDDAIRTYRRANELAKKLGDNEMSAILHFNLAMTYYKLGSLDQAVDECAAAVKINGKYIKAHLKRGEIYQRQRKFDEAVICYEHICELDNTNRDYAILLNHAKEAAKHTRKKDYYEILGLTANFTQEDVKKAYRQRALSHHPDRHSDADIVTRRIQEKHFKDVSEAHSYIQKRFGYR